MKGLKDLTKRDKQRLKRSKRKIAKIFQNNQYGKRFESASNELGVNKTVILRTLQNKL